MRIAEVKTYLLERPLSSSMRISRGGFDKRQHVLVEVRTDSGVTGLGEGIGNAPLIRSLLDSNLGPKAIGLDPFALTKLRQELFEGTVYFERKGSVLCAVSALEMACVDIKGKALGVPAYELLGGRVHRTLPCYASDIYWDESPQAMAQYARAKVEHGFTAVKAHLGARGPEEECARIEAIREAIGPKVRLMLDVNAGYGSHDAARALSLWAPYDVAWLEEPVHPDAIDALASLRKRASMPIAAGENEFGLTGFRQLFEAGAVDVAMPDVGRVGGLTATQEILALAAAFGIDVSLHNFSSGVLLAATLHVSMSSPNVRLVEMDDSQNAVLRELFIEPPVLTDGRVGLSDAPGLGVHLSEAALRYRVA